MVSKKVSVIVPAYNAEDCIPSAIQSVVDQTYADWELLVVNDGSTDRTLEVCRSFQDPRIQLIDQPNQGVSEARNAGIRNAQGEYIAFLDADDIWLPEKLEKQVAFLESHPSVGLVFCGARLMDKAGARLGIQQISKTGEVSPVDVFLLNPVKNGSVAVVRKQALESVKFTATLADGTARDSCYFDPLLVGPEDMECWLRIVLTTAWKIRGISDCLVFYRISPAGLSLSLDKYHAGWLKVQGKVQASCPAFFQKYARLASAFEYRYLAQRGILAGAEKGKVLRLSVQSVLADPRIIFKDPFVTLVTLIAAWGYLLLPRSVFRKIMFPMQSMVNFLFLRESQG